MLPRGVGVVYQPERQSCMMQRLEGQRIWFYIEEQ